MIRPIEPRDLLRLKELQEFEWEPDPIEGLVAVDENDIPIMFAGAWHRAEVHVALDKKWSTPGARLLLLKELHDAMQAQLSRKGIRQVVTWFEETRATRRFRNRLEKWGWVESEFKSMHRKVF